MWRFRSMLFFRVMASAHEGKESLIQQYRARREAADYLTRLGLKITWRTLQKKATTGGGPPYSIFGNRAVYTTEALDAWAEEKLSAPRRSTSEAAQMARTKPLFIDKYGKRHTEAVLRHWHPTVIKALGVRRVSEPEPKSTNERNTEK